MITQLLHSLSSTTNHTTILSILNKLREYPKEDWDKFVHFDEENYTRNVFFVNNDISAMLLCWKPGQQTPLHVHPSNSTSFIFIISGTLLLKRDRSSDIESDSKRLKPSSNCHTTSSPCCYNDDYMMLEVGQVYKFSSSDLGIHSLGNEKDKSQFTVSFHVTLPPMLHSCSIEPSYICGNTPSLYTNFRNLVHILSQQIKPLKSGEVHDDEHIQFITNLLSSMRFNSKEYEKYVKFTKDTYTRSLVGFDVPTDSNPRFTVLCLCWDKGQMSVIHNHAGSSCWVKVLKGRVREVRYKVDELNNNALSKISDNVFESEQATYINDTRGLHSMGNADDNEIAVTLHVYAPPYMLCKLYSLENPGKVSIGNMAVVPEAPINPSNLLSTSKSDGSNPLSLDAFIAKIKDKVELDGSCPIASDLLKKLNLEDYQWKELCHFDKHHYSRSLVALDRDFSLMLLCFAPGQKTPIHGHGKGVRTWAKILAGSITVRTFDKKSRCAPKSTQIFGVGDVIDETSFDGEHELSNDQSHPAVCLHLYSPPYVTMAYVDSISNREVQIPLVHAATTSLSRCCQKELKKLEGVYYGSFEDCLNDLIQEFSFPTKEGLVESISSTLERIEIQQDEIEQNLLNIQKSGCHVLNRNRNKFFMELHEWTDIKEKEIENANCWIKFLNGSCHLVQKERTNGDVVSRVKLTAPSVVYIGKSDKISSYLEFPTPAECSDHQKSRIISLHVKPSSNHSTQI